MASQQSGFPIGAEFPLLFQLIERFDLLVQLADVVHYLREKAVVMCTEVLGPESLRRTQAAVP